MSDDDNDNDDDDDDDGDGGDGEEPTKAAVESVGQPRWVEAIS